MDAKARTTHQVHAHAGSAECMQSKHSLDVLLAIGVLSDAYGGSLSRAAIRSSWATADGLAVRFLVMGNGSSLDGSEGDVLLQPSGTTMARALLNWRE